MKTGITSKDVAELAKVSQATVSYVLNNNQKQSISEETKQKILNAAKELNYIPNIAARTLKNNKTSCISVAINKNLMTPRYSELVEGIRSILENANYNIMLCSNKKYLSIFPNYLNSYLQQRTDAIIYIGADGLSIEPESMDYIIKNQIPLVVFGYDTQNDTIPDVNIDYFYGAYDGTNHLINKGYKNLIYFRPNININQETQREEGVHTACKESTDINLTIHNINFPYFNEIDLLFSKKNNKSIWRTEFYNLVNSIIDNKSTDYAIICSWVYMTEIVSKLLLTKGLKIPVLSLAQIDLFANSGENFIFSHLPNYIAGQECAKAILKLLNNPNDISKVLLRPKLETNNPIL
ncbi:transcriptional regulator, LacI family [Propionispira arboris]|uniref:Transcriptional regulator, LacI family n=1 Tax=Propionispira arboris TaxID=84035 RepID=A0A1H7BY97_9FIRM|nr:LacI family DNA-binding transcriptional regulator [Propionispira arboris]SEJ81994.1 transcriptional regulator, LacI family [Propionispira arboris]